MSAKRLFIAATRQNDGKTMTSLGLYNAFQKRFKSTIGNKLIVTGADVVSHSKKISCN